MSPVDSTNEWKSSPNPKSIIFNFSKLFSKEAKEEGGVGKEVATEAAKEKA